MKLYIYIIVFLFLTIQSWGQFPRPSVSTQSPNAASLGMYGDIPVSQYTGIPQISIPLYTLEEGKIRIPISLSYHASGVRPNQHPGWVGMGWSLNAGGAITRKVRDLPDDIVSGNPSPGLFSTNSLLRPSNANPNYWETSAYINSLANTNYASIVDTEPDEFDFNFLGYSGSFYVDGESGTLKVRSEHQFKVEALNSNAICPPTKFVGLSKGNNQNYQTLDCDLRSHPSYVREFKLTDLDGTVYYFGSDVSAIEFSINFFMQYNIPWIANAWYLKKIVTLEGRTVNFNYDDGSPSDGYPFLANLSYSYYTEDSQINGGPFATNLLQAIFNPNLNPSCSEWSVDSNPHIFGGDLVRPVYLKDITITTTNNATNNHKIVFEKTLSNEQKYPDRIFTDFYNKKHIGFNGFKASELFPYLTGFNETDGNILTYTNRLKWYKLSSLKIYNQRQELINQYNFNYNDNDLATERLFLNSISKKETGANALQTYNFTYFDKATLPEYFDIYDKTDHWGFLNEGSGGLVKSIIANKNGTALFTKKQPTNDYNLTKKGTLSSIVFPTGGTNTFEYELNSYSKLISPERNTFVSGVTTTITGGLRIKKITSCESSVATNCTTKEYFYVTGYNSTIAPTTLPSSGILAGMPQYSWNYNYSVPGYNVTSYVFSAFNLLPSNENSSGSHIGYSEVVEKQNGNGYTVSKFTNFGTEGGQHMDEKVADASRLNLSSVRTIYEPFIDKSYERGKLTSQEVYTSAGNLVNSRSINYSIVNPSVIRAIKASSLFICGTQIIIPSGTAYKIHKSLYLPSSETNIQYGTNGGNGSVTTLTNYEYNNLGFEKIKKIKQSDGSELVTRKVYVGDLSVISDAQLQNNAQNYCLASPRPLEYNSCYFPCVQSGGTNCEVTCNTQCVNSYINQRVNKPNTVDLRQMLNSYVLAPVIEQQTWKLTPTPTGFDEKLLSGGINFFKKYTNGFQVKQSYSLPQLPDITDLPTPNRRYSTFPYSNIDTDYNFNFYNKYSSFAPVVKFDDIYGYDSRGNICQFNGRDGVPTTYIWGYQNMYPVATIVGATYQEVVAYLGYSPNEDANFQSKLRKVDILPLLQALRNAINTNKPIAQITTRTYLSGIGIDSETAPSGLVVSYVYDSFNRLKTVYDNAGKVIKSYSYNYKNQ